MKLFKAFNGFIGFSDVHLYVVAEDENKALELATEQFKKNTLPHDPNEVNKRYYEDLEIEFICDCDKEFVTEILSFLKNGFVVSPHFDDKNCAYIEATIRPKKYQNEPLDEQIESYKKEGFPQNLGLYECGISARDMNNQDVKKLGELWHEQNLNWSYQDQVSFPYCLWKTQYKPDVLPQTFRNYNWVRINAHTRED
jgi:hypothetical protein